MSETDHQDQLLNSCPACQGVIDVSAVRPYDKIVCPLCEDYIRVRTNFQHFTINSELGEGGMSRVFQAFDNNLGRNVALKILHSEFGNDPELRAQFEREARITASLSHPNVVQVYSVGWDQGYFYIAMELLETEALDDQIAAYGLIDEIVALRVLHEVTLGLAYANGAGLIHRDIKPGNILVDSAGTAKLVDFGLALAAGEDENLAEWATPFYVPPEKLTGDPEDFRSDIYSLGSTFFHMISGVPPYDANTDSMSELIEIKSQAVDVRKVAPVKLNDGTFQLTRKMMTGAPAGRHKSYEELLEEIIKLREKIDPDFEVERKEAGGFPIWMKLAAVALVAGFLGLLYMLLFAGRPDNTVDLNNGGGSTNGGRSSSGLSGGETIVSAADTAKLRQLEVAKQALANGQLEMARGLFGKLISLDTMRKDLPVWAEFHLGLIDLLEGKSADVSAHFSKASELSADLGDELHLPLKHLYDRLQASNFTVDEAEQSKAENKLFALTSLPIGLTSWAGDSHGVTQAFLQAYVDAEFEGEQEWMGAYGGLVAEHISDCEILNSVAEVPEDGSKEDFETVIAAWTEQAEKLKLKKDHPIFDERTKQAQLRINQIQQKLAMAARQKDDKILQEAEAAASILIPDLKFAEGAAIWRAVEPGSSDARKVSLSRAEAWEEAAKFIPLFGKFIPSQRYDGEILRKTGTPFKAKIVNANATAISVDLGFGATAIPLEQLAPEGIYKIAKATMLKTVEDDELLQAACFYGWFLGEKEYAMDLAQELEDVIGFTRRWDAITIPVDFR